MNYFVKYRPLAPMHGDVLFRPRCYEQAEHVMYRIDGRPIISRKIANHTFLVRVEDGIAVRFHDTDVLTWMPNDLIRISTGGWHTMSTRDRINRHILAKYRIYISRDTATRGFWYTTLLAPRQDGEGNYVYEGWVHDDMILDMRTQTEFSKPYDPSIDIQWNRNIERLMTNYFRTYRESWTDGLDDLRHGWFNAPDEVHLIPRYQYYLFEVLRQKAYNMAKIRGEMQQFGFISHLFHLHANEAAMKKSLRQYFRYWLLRGSIRKHPLKGAPWNGT